MQSTKTKPSEYHWSNDRHKFKCIGYTEGNKVQTTRNNHCNLFHEIEKQQTFLPNETLHVPQICSIHRHRMGCKEHD
jgi:hypothetical protein